MKKLLLLSSVSIMLTLTSCDYIKNKVFKPSIEGTYVNGEGIHMEFTESTVTYDDAMSFKYRIEGEYLFVEGFGIGELKFGDMRYKIADGNTIILAGGFSSNTDEAETVFKKIEK